MKTLPDKYKKPLLFVLAVFLGLTSRWAYKTWPRLNIEETIYHLTAPIQGTGGGIIEGFLLTCLLPSLVLLVICVIYAAVNQGRRSFFRLKRAVAAGHNTGPCKVEAVIGTISPSTTT